MDIKKDNRTDIVNRQKQRSSLGKSFMPYHEQQKSKTKYETESVHSGAYSDLMNDGLDDLLLNISMNHEHYKNENCIIQVPIDDKDLSDDVLSRNELPSADNKVDEILKDIRCAEFR